MTFNTDLCLTNTEVTIDSYNKNYVTDVPKCIIYEPTSKNRILRVSKFHGNTPYIRISSIQYRILVDLHILNIDPEKTDAPL